MVLEEIGPVLHHVVEEERTHLGGGRLIVSKHSTPPDISLNVGRMKTKQSSKKNLLSAKDLTIFALEARREPEGRFEVPDLRLTIETKQVMD